MPGTPRSCELHLDLVKFDYRLPRFAESLKRQRKTKVVAIGSSSTAGVNDNVVPFPYRLELALRGGSYGRMIDVLNRGIGGQEAPEELSRFECDVIAEAPALVIWQVGTNAVYRKLDYNFDDVEKAIVAGLDWLAGLPVDVVLMDLQYTKAIVDKIDLANDIEARIATVATNAKVNLFRRWALMKRWCVEDHVSLAEMDDGVDPNLHMSEWATGCVTQSLDGAIAGALAASAS